MHLLGKSLISYGVTPASDTIPFIDIPQWDFHWQGLYSFPRVLKVPLGTIVYSSAFYDNTTANHENPNDPPAWVFLGESTTDEMMLVYFAYTLYFPGDENIIIDSNIVSNIQPVTSSVISTCQLYDPSPNPATDNMTVQYFIPSSDAVTLRIIDITGKICLSMLQKKAQGLITDNFDVSVLPAGNYFLQLITGELIRTKKFMKN
jgi:hypothetical protein